MEVINLLSLLSFTVQASPKIPRTFTKLMSFMLVFYASLGRASTKQPGVAIYQGNSAYTILPGSFSMNQDNVHYMAGYIYPDNTINSAKSILCRFNENDTVSWCKTHDDGSKNAFITGTTFNDTLYSGGSTARTGNTMPYFSVNNENDGSLKCSSYVDMSGYTSAQFQTVLPYNESIFALGYTNTNSFLMAFSPNSCLPYAATAITLPWSSSAFTMTIYNQSFYVTTATTTTPKKASLTHLTFNGTHWHEQWTRTYSSGSNNFNIFGINANDGLVFFTGLVGSDAFIASINASTGVENFMQSIGGTGTDIIKSVIFQAVSNDNSTPKLLFAGNTNSGLSQQSAWFLKTDLNGTIDKNIALYSSAGSSLGLGLLINSGGTIASLGRTTSYGGSYYKPMLLTFDHNLNLDQSLLPSTIQYTYLSGMTIGSQTISATSNTVSLTTFTPVVSLITNSIVVTDSQVTAIWHTVGASPTSRPSAAPSTQPTSSPTEQPNVAPSTQPTSNPTAQPNVAPSTQPTSSPTAQPNVAPSTQPTSSPTAQPNVAPSAQPTSSPTAQPNVAPSAQPTSSPTAQPNVAPSTQPTSSPTAQPNVAPSTQPTSSPTAQPNVAPSTQPTSSPTAQPNVAPSTQPTSTPTAQPNVAPSTQPKSTPTAQPNVAPSTQPTSSPTAQPNAVPSTQPTSSPTAQPNAVPSTQPTSSPTSNPSNTPTVHPTVNPSANPTYRPTQLSIGNWTARITQRAELYDLTQMQGKTIACGGNVTALCFQFDNPNGKLSATYGFPWGLNRAVVAVNESSLVLVGENATSSVVAYADMNTQKIQWGYAYPSITLIGSSFNSATQQVVVSGYDTNNYVIVSSMDAATGLRAWSYTYILPYQKMVINNHQPIPRSDTHLEYSLGGQSLVGYSINHGGSYSGLLLRIDHLSQQGTFCTLSQNLNNVVNERTIMTTQALDPITLDPFLIGTSAQTPTEIPHAFITRRDGFSLQEQWSKNYYNGQPVQLNDVVQINDRLYVLGNGFTTTGAACVFLIQIDANTGENLRSVRMILVNNGAWASRALALVDNALRFACVVDGYPMIFSAQPNSLNLGPLPSGILAFYDDIATFLPSGTGHYTIIGQNVRYTANEIGEPLDTNHLLIENLASYTDGSSSKPTKSPTVKPSLTPTQTGVPTKKPTRKPSQESHITSNTTEVPSTEPTESPTESPSAAPIPPSSYPTNTNQPSIKTPTFYPSIRLSPKPTNAASPGFSPYTTGAPSAESSAFDVSTPPSASASIPPSKQPSQGPSSDNPPVDQQEDDDNDNAKAPSVDYGSWLLIGSIITSALSLCAFFYYHCVIKPRRAIHAAFTSSQQQPNSPEPIAPVDENNAPASDDESSDYDSPVFDEDDNSSSCQSINNTLALASQHARQKIFPEDVAYLYEQQKFYPEDTGYFYNQQTFDVENQIKDQNDYQNEESTTPYQYEPALLYRYEPTFYSQDMKVENDSLSPYNKAYRHTHTFFHLTTRDTSNDDVDSDMIDALSVEWNDEQCDSPSPTNVHDIRRANQTK